MLTVEESAEFTRIVCTMVKGGDAADAAPLVADTCELLQRNRAAAAAHDPSASPRDTSYLSFLLDALLDRFEDDAEKVVQLFNAFPKEGLEVNNFIATRVITAYGKLDRTDDALRLLEGMGRAADAKTYGALIAIHAKSGAVAKVDALLARMRELGLKPDERSRGSQVMAHAKTRVPDIERAVALFDGLRRDGLQPHLSVCNALVTACIRPAAVPQALHVLRSMIEDRTAPNSVTLATLLQTCWTARDPASAIEVLDRCIACGLVDRRLGLALDGRPGVLTLEPCRLIVDRRDAWRTDFALEALGWAITHFHLSRNAVDRDTTIEGRPRARDAAVAVRYLASESARS